MELAEESGKDIIPAHGIGKSRCVEEPGVKRRHGCKDAHADEGYRTRHAEEVRAENNMGNRCAAGQLLRREAHEHGDNEKRIGCGEQADRPEHALPDEPVVRGLLGQRGDPLVADKEKNADSGRLNNVCQGEFGALCGEADVDIMRGECIERNANHESNHAVGHDVLDKAGDVNPPEVDQSHKEDKENYPEQLVVKRIEYLKGAGQDAGQQVAFGSHHGDSQNDIKHADDDGNFFVKSILNIEFDSRRRRVEGSQFRETHGGQQAQKTRNYNGNPGELADKNSGYLESRQIARSGNGHPRGCGNDGAEFDDFFKLSH